MSRPSFLCLCAVWNHRHEWTENLIQLFKDQDYDGHADLVLIDDRPHDECWTGWLDYIDQTKRGIYHHRTTIRYPSLPAKYNKMLEVFAKSIKKGDYKYICVMDDDDIYLPHFLSDHADVLAHHPWSYPEHVFSWYAGTFQKEESGGRFWTSTAYTIDALNAVGNYGEDVEMIYDQRFLHRMLETHGKPGSPRRPGYVYNWGSGDNHVSGDPGQGLSGWYDNCKPSEFEGFFLPEYNELTRNLLRLAAVFRG